MDDELKIRRALELAERGWGRVAPNPLVGCVIEDPLGVVSEGWHEGPGTPHAEAMALAAAGEAARGATLYCTLEPCDHTGRTGPCTQAIIDAGIARVVLGARDPNPLVDGRGVARLRAAGITVDTDVLRTECARLIEAYGKHITTGTPWVTLKLALTLDGRTAARDGSSKWITAEPARERVHRLRAGAAAVMVGSGTALTDDPRLTVRDIPNAGPQPLRVLVDSAGRVPAAGGLFDGEAPTLVATTDASSSTRREEWSESGAEVVVLDADAHGRVHLPALMDLLGKRDLQSVLLEGGPTLAASALRSDVVDKLVWFLGAQLIGGDGSPALGELGVGSIAEARAVDVVSARVVGPDLEVEAYVHRDH